MVFVKAPLFKALALFTLLIAIGLQPLLAQQKSGAESPAADVAQGAPGGTPSVHVQAGVTKSLAALKASKSASTNILHDNGSFINSPGTGAGGADESVMQNVTLGADVYGWAHQQSAAYRISDDFTLHGTSFLESISFYAYQTGSSTTSTITAVNYRIWDGVPGAPGSSVVFGDTGTNRLTGTSWTGVYRVIEAGFCESGCTDRPIMENTVSAGVTLDAGTYWLDWQSAGSLISGPWANPITTGACTTGNGFQSSNNGVSWFPVSSTFGCEGQQDFPFIIEGYSHDLALEKAVDVEGIEGTYTLTLTNNGVSPFTGIEVTDYMPDGVTITSNTPSQGSFDAQSGIWYVGDLDAGLTATLTINVAFPSGESTNRAEITYSNETDQNPDNDSDEVTSFIRFGNDTFEGGFSGGGGPGGGPGQGGRRFEADLSLYKSVDQESGVATGTDVTYRLQILNHGPSTTAGVAVTDHLPECLDFVSAEASKGSFDDATGIWAVGGMRVGAVETLDIVTTVTSACAGDVVNTAWVSSSNLPDPDSANRLIGNSGNDDATSSASFSVSAGAAGKVSLLDNYPNPFNPETVIPFEMKQGGVVKVAVYDMLGRHVQTLVNGHLETGLHEVSFRAGNIPTGVYLVRLEAFGHQLTHQITLMK